MLQRLTTSLGYLRPRSLARTRKALDDVVADARELRQAMRSLVEQDGHGRRSLQGLAEDLATQIGSIKSDLAEIRESLSALARRESQLRAIALADAALERHYDGLPAILNEAAIATHVRAAIDRAELHLEPFPYLVVRELFPARFYDALILGLPPVELFEGRTNKTQLVVPFTMGPAYGRRVWRFMAGLADRVLAPIVAERLRAPLSDWMASDWPSLASGDAKLFDMHASDGRILLRGRGYNIPPHRDPKWGFITCLMYLARPGDSDAWGTSLYTVDGDGEAVGALPHWISSERCRHVTDVPFRPNSALIFLNSKGAHGASIPDDAEPADLERYAYQFRVGPTRSAMAAMMALLPEERKAAWAGKLSAY